MNSNYDFPVKVFLKVLDSKEMEIKYQGEDIDVGFNVTYLIDVLNNIQYDKLNFAFKDSSSSCLVTIPNNEDYKYVVMPMRI